MSQANPPTFTRETTIRRDREGQWFHDGVRVENEAVARAFDRWVDVAEDGRTILRNSVNWAYVEIEGPPLFVVRVHRVDGQLSLQLSDGTRETLPAEAELFDEAGILVTKVRRQTMKAAFSRKAMMDVVPLLEEADSGAVLVAGEHRWLIRPTSAQ